MRLECSLARRPRSGRSIKGCVEPLAFVVAGAAVALAIVVALASPRALAQSSPGAYRVVVSPSNPTHELDRNFVAQAFLKKVTRWPSGDPIEPVDLDQRSPVRRRFSNEVLNRSVEAVKSYWQQMIFSGRALPPPEVTTDDQVIDFVLHRAGSIGYVSAGANLHGAREVIVE